MNFLRKFINAFLKIFDLKLIRSSSNIIYETPKRFTYVSIEKYFDEFCKYSRSKYGQEWLVYKLLGEKKGYFVEIGAADGIHSSNTYFLENVLSWSGILVEPAKRFHNNLRLNRKNIIETDCVHSQSNMTVLFNETTNAAFGGSYISDYQKINSHKQIKKTYPSNTISLNDLLSKHNSPKKINFLSLDTEGNEYEILKNFNFSDRKIDILCIETNYDIEKKNLFTKLLTLNDYCLLDLPDNIAKNDTWFVSKEISKINFLNL